MKIIFIVSALHGGGAERVVTTLANNYAEQGDEVTILMTAGDECVYPVHQSIQLFSIGQASHGNPVIQIKRLFRLRKYLKAHRDSKIVSFSTTINLFTIIASFGLHMRIVASERNDPRRYKHQRFRNFIYLFGKGFVFQTEDAKECFPDKIKKIGIIIPNPIRKDLPEPFLGERNKCIAAVGRLELQKNHVLLLEAFAGFHKKYPDYELHIFGIGKLEKDLKIKALELKIDRYVVFEGFCKDVLEIIRSYGMYILSSNYEGISNSLMEAMALGIPCISTDCPIGGSAMCIQNEKNGLLVPVGNREALQRAMEKLAGDTVLANKVSRNAVIIRDAFDEKKIADRWREYICK